MRLRFRHLHRNEGGFSLVLVSIGFMAFFAATTLAVDVGLSMTARTQAQNSADAGALAGATALAFNSFTDHSAGGPAVQSAINAALANKLMGQPPSVLPTDVTFPLDPITGQFDRVQVSVYRTSGRGNPLPTLIAGIFGLSTVDIGATAMAEAAPANAEICVMPFTIPDRWIENSSGKAVPDGPWSPISQFDLYFSKGNGQNNGLPLPNPDVYIPPGQAGATGYNPATDIGLQLILKTNNNNKVAPSMYNPWDLPGSVGGNDYRNNIGTCNTNLVSMGDMMTPENGNMVGPTKQGTDDLIAQDPNAIWDTTCNCVKGSAFPISPRIAKVPLYDPSIYAQGQQTGKANPQLQVVNYLGFFIEGATGGGQVTGRITPITGLATGVGPVPTGAFPVAIRLAQ